ncbi:MOLPALP family lipoprotein [Spiroplasma alleghenense]|uniref:MOLPALP family lipoprotein n=1 Tax=Spiroplasma alleghenense TaxID=216931 RepID=A0A345Z564_9MOLU|nr:MOLPALP family lipoprotein [Spiroplasma alleghenense]AXK51743.1 MOLPALP family lipoprotein [Spiroplasma alleghenense]
MRKLLSILATVSLTASVATTTVSCTTSKFNMDVALSANNINNLKIGLAQASKSLVLNHENGLDSEYILENYFAPSVIEDNFEGFDKSDFSGVSRTRFTNLFKKYFNSKNPVKPSEISSGLKLNGSKKVTSGGSLFSALAGFSDLIGTIVSGKTLEFLINLADGSGLVEGLLDPLLGKTVSGLLDEETLNALGNALDLNVYQGMSYQDVLQNGMNSLSNGLVRLSGNPKNVKLAEIGIENDSKNNDIAIQNMADSLTSLGSIMGDLDIINNLVGFADILHFAYITLTYINQFDSFRSFKPSDSQHLFVSGETSITTLKRVRSQKFDIKDGEPNIAKLIANLQFYLSVDEKDTDGRNFQRLISILFESDSKVNIVPIIGPSFSNGGINWLIKPIVTLLIDKMGVPDLMKSYLQGTLAVIFNDIATDSSLKNITNWLKNKLIWSFLDDSMKNMVNKIVDDKELHETPYKAIYSGSGISSLMNIFGMSDGGVNPDLNISNLLKNSLTTTLDAVAKELKVDRYTSISSNNTIKVQTLSELFKKLGEIEAWEDSNGKKNSTTVLEHALVVPKDMFLTLGLDKKTQSFENGSALQLLKSFLQQSLEGFKELDTLLSMIGKKGIAENKEIQQEIDEVVSNPEDWKIVDSQNNLMFDNIIGDITIDLKHIIQDNETVYSITAKREKSGYFKITDFEIVK